MSDDDQAVLGHIEELVAEEHRLLDAGAGRGPDEAEHARLEEVRVALDRCWDLLRRRRAREEFGLDAGRYDPPRRRDGGGLRAVGAQAVAAMTTRSAMPTSAPAAVITVATASLGSAKSPARIARSTAIRRHCP